jgi:hypothetical protein
MNIDINKVEARTNAVVAVGVTGTPTVKVWWNGREILPHSLEIEYTYRPGRTEDGWNSHLWVAGSVKVSGHRVLKPGADGAQRLGKEEHTTDWRGWNDDVQANDATRSGVYAPLPEWLDSLVSELRPSGEIALPGGAK